MFFPEGRIRVFLYGQPVDGRKSFDGLYALTCSTLQQDPLSGHLFCFVNRRANLMRVLYWDRSGFCLWSKRPTWYGPGITGHRGYLATSIIR